MNLKRWVIQISVFFFQEITLFLIQEVFIIKINEMSTLKTIIDNAIIIGTCLAVLIAIIIYLYWYFSEMKKQISYLIVKSKYYDIMVTKMDITNPIHVNNTDKQFFTKEELIILDECLKNNAKLRILMKGTGQIV